MRSLGVLLEWVAGSILFVLLVVGVLQVTSRYTGLMFVPWTEEVARLLFVWLSGSGLPRPYSAAATSALIS